MSKALVRAQRARRIVPAAVLLVGAVLLGSPGCGTDAVGIDDCRDIERARCEAAAHCGLVDDVDECQRFYRDQCLHGLSVESPGSIAVERCVEVIRLAGDCARDHGGTDADLDDCVEEPSSETVDAQTACDLVLYPERSRECRFLTPNPPEPSGEGGEGGQTAPGASGATGEAGAGGQGGA
jgi:hypothetical protein